MLKYCKYAIIESEEDFKKNFGIKAFLKKLKIYKIF